MAILIQPIKYLFLLFMLVCVILAGIPGIIGMEVEKQYRLLTEQFEQSGIRSVDHRYIRSWFSAEAETEMVYTIPPALSMHAEQREIRFSLKSRIAHGPLTITGRIGLVDINTRFLSAGNNRLPQDNPATLKTLIVLNGAGRIIIDIPAVDLAAEGGQEQISIGGLAGEIQYAAGMSSIRVDAGIKGLTLERGSEKQLVLGQLSIDTESWLSTTGLSLGKGNLSLTELELYGKGGARALKLDQMDFEFESSATADHATLKAIHTVGRADIDGAVYGPGRIALVVDDLPVPALIKIQEAMKVLNRQQLPQEQQRMAMMNILMAHGPGLLTDDPWFAIEALQLETPKGRITGALRLQPRGMNWIDIIKGSWVKKILGDASLRVPEPIFTQMLQRLVEQRISQQYESLISQGLLKRDNGDITVAATLSKGVLNLNGRTIPNIIR